MEGAPINKVVSHHPSSPSTFTWKISNFSSMGKDKIYSDIFIAGGCSWRLLVFPKGNRADGLSLYLDAADIGKLIYEGNGPIKFSLAVINQLDETLTVRKDASHAFDALASDWGFRVMIPSKDLSSTRGFLVDDTCLVEVEFETLKCPEATQENERESKTPMDEKNGKQGVKADERKHGELQERNEEEEKLDKGMEVSGEETREKHRISEGSTETEATKAGKDAGQTELQKPSAPHPSSPTGTEQVDGTAQARSSPIDYAPLFEYIANVIGKAAACPDQEEISKSLSLLKQLSSQSFSEITLNARADLISAFQVLIQATSLPSDQASAINNFFNQFEDLCESYDSSISTSRTAQLYFDSKDKNFELLKNLHEFQSKILTSIKDIENEKVTLQRRLGELDESRHRKLDEYAAAGEEAATVKAEWDALMVNHAAMADQRKKAENEMANVETQWKSFISLFK